MPTCEREATDSGVPGNLCKHHIGALDTDSSDEFSGFDADNPGSTTGLNQQSADDGGDVLVNDALADALAWFHHQLDRDLPDECDHDTPRDYYRDGRGWGADTIDAKRLGYAPANCRDELVTHLFDRGHDREAILSTGLFGERDDGNLYATWSGRYVLPYFDAAGRPVFAISRATDPVHPADWKDNRYDKPPTSRDDVTAEEPIYGLDTVREGEPVLITEGIADAITAHEAGYPCLSPVTIQFKKRDRENLLEALAEQEVGRAYLIQDAERPTSSVDDRDRLTLQQFGDGVNGAVITAAYLADHGLDARVADLPRPGLEKVDLDDYLQGWSDDLTPLLASAKPVDQHPAYDPATTKDIALEGAKASGRSAGRDSGETDDNAARSALFALDIEDVTGEREGYRGKNPLGHHGESENYFVLPEDRDLAVDYKHKAAYNSLTYLLVDAGERRPDSPNGQLNAEEMFAAWSHAKGERVIPEDDPIPLEALQHVAAEATEWDGNLVEHETADGETFDGLPMPVYNAALEACRDEYDLDPGRDTLEAARGAVDADPVAPLALAKLDVLSGPERVRYARKQGLEILSTDDARERLRNGIFRELRAGNHTVQDAPTALGKSYTVATEPWRCYADVTGEAPVIHLHPTRDARDEAATETANSSAVGAALKGRKEISPVARGDHDPPSEEDEEPPEQVVTVDGLAASEWFDLQCDEKGLPFSTALALARDRNDQGLKDLPPVGEEDPAVAQWNGIPRDDEGNPAVDVLHATHQFAYVPSLRRYTNVVLDECPDYSIDLRHDRIRKMVNAYLQVIGAPVSTWEAFIQLARFDTDGSWSDAAAEQDALDDALGEKPPTEWYVEDRDAHALAPDLTRAIWNALRYNDADANGRRNAKVLHDPPRFGDGEGDSYAGTWLSVVIDEENTVRTVRNTPDFSQARAVVGLDAHPSMPMWQLNAGPNMIRDAVLEGEERRLWRRYERGLTVVQIGNADRPRSGEKAREWMNDERVRTVVEALREHYGAGFDTAISPIQVERPLRRILEDVVGTELDDDCTMHYGEEKSRNPEAFANAVAGYLYACMDPGDDMILDALAELGLEATPTRADCTHCGGDGKCSDDCDDGRCDPDTERCGVCDGEGWKREKGRTFDGPDADTAKAVLESVRENHVAQGAGRYARSPDDPDDSVIVYAHTAALPAGFADLQVPGVEWIATDLQREILETLVERSSATALEIADAVDCTKEHVHGTLKRLEGEDLVDRYRAAGAHGADVYRGDDIAAGLLDLGLDETANAPLKDLSRWSLAVSDLHDPPERSHSPAEASPSARATANSDDRPPDDPI